MVGRSLIDLATLLVYNESRDVTLTHAHARNSSIALARVFYDNHSSDDPIVLLLTPVVVVIDCCLGAGWVVLATGADRWCIFVRFN